MKPILFLNDQPETVRLMFEEVPSGSAAVSESEARAGCDCDRWGHPCPKRLKRNTQQKRPLRFQPQSNREVIKWNT
jgi:hypothetical protein